MNLNIEMSLVDLMNHLEAYPEDLAFVLHILNKRQGMTKRSLAFMCGINERTFQRVYNEKRTLKNKAKHLQACENLKKYLIG